MKIVKTFAIETSCDDTSIALVRFDGKRFEVEKMLSYSQTQEHKKYGGVVPEVASRLHEEKILILLDEFGKENIEKADFISVTSEPGLPGSLIVGITTAYSLGNFLNKKIVEVNHIHGHIFSLFLDRNIDEIKFPLVVLTASGGHNEIWVVGGDNRRGLKITEDENDLSSVISDNLLGSNFSQIYSEFPHRFSLFRVGYTLDDAAGEAFDKVARMLGGPYPGGPWISRKAEQIKENLIADEIKQLVEKKIRPIFLSSEKFEFSFSGYKSQVYYLLQELESRGIKLNDEIVSYVASKFQKVVIEVLAKKLIQAAIKFGAKTIGITGGVSANDRLFEYLNELVEKKKQKRQLSEEIKVIRPVKKIYSTDNAAMIGVAGIFQSVIDNGEGKNM